MANISSAIDVEQLLGRVMRMPYAKARDQERLNMAYAHVVSSGFGKASGEINGCLCNMGFDAEEAAENIRQLPLPGGEDIWGDKPLLQYGKEECLEVELDREPDFSGPDEEETRHITVAKHAGRITVSARGMLTKDAEERIIAAVKKEKQFQARYEITRRRQKVMAKMPPTPAAKGITLTAPLLLWEKDGEFEQADAEFLLPSDWSPLDNISEGKPLFDRAEFDYDPKIKAFQFDLAGERMTYHSLGESEQGFLYAMPQSYDEYALARWLDRNCRQDDISQCGMLEFCRRAVQSLLEAGHDLDALFQGKKLIARLIRDKLSLLRARAQKSAFQNLLAGSQGRELNFMKVLFSPNPVTRKMSPATSSKTLYRHASGFKSQRRGISLRPGSGHAPVSGNLASQCGSASRLFLPAHIHR